VVPSIYMLVAKRHVALEDEFPREEATSLPEPEEATV